MFLRAFILFITCSISCSATSQKYQGTVKENPLKVPKKAKFTHTYEVQKATNDEPSTKHSAVSDVILNEETIIFKLQVCESKIAYNPSEDLSKQYAVLRKSFLDFVTNSNMNELSTIEKTKYMSLMKEAGNIEEYTKAKNSLRAK
jgi:K+-transporting ATPase A subunit